MAENSPPSSKLYACACHGGSACCARIMEKRVVLNNAHKLVVTLRHYVGPA